MKTKTNHRQRQACQPTVSLFKSTVITLVLALLAPSAFAATQIWTNAPADQNLANNLNWVSAVAPINGDTVQFNDSAITNLNNNLPDATTLLLTFNLTTNATYTVTNTANSITLSNLTDNSLTPVKFTGGAFWLPANKTLSVVPGGNLIIGSTFSNSLGNNTLTVGQSITVPAQQTPAVPGVVINNANTATVTLNGALPNAYTNTTTLNSGTALVLDFANMATPVNLLSTNAVALNGAIYSLKGKSTGSTFQTNNGAGTITFATGGSIISLNNNGGAGTTLKLGSTWARTAPATVTVDTSLGGTLLANPPLGNGILAYAAVTDATASGFATTNSSGAIVRYTATTALDPAANSAVTNYSVAGNLTMNPASFAVNSLTLDASGGNGSLDLGGAGNFVTNTSKAILMTGGNNFTLKNGQLATSGSEVIIHQMGTGVLTNSATIGAGAAFLTKNGPGTLLLTGASTNTGTSIINRGTVKLGISSTPGSGPFGNTTNGLTVNGGGVLDLNGNNLTVGTYNASGFGMVTNSTGGAPAVITLGNGNNRLSGLSSTFWAGNLTIKIVGNNGTRDDFGGNFQSTHTGGTIYQGNNLADRIINPYVLGYGPVTFNGSGGFTIPSQGTSLNTGSMTNPIVVNGSGNVVNFQASANFAGPWSGSGTLTINNGFGPTFTFGGDLSAFQGTNILQSAGNATVNYTLGYVNTTAANTGGSAAAVFDLQTASTFGLNFQYNNTNTPATIRLGDLNTTGNAGSGTITLRNGAASTAVTFEVGALNASSTFSGNIVNNAAGSTVAITKVGTGNWTLSGASLSYTGPTTISNGILTVNGPLSASLVNVFTPGALAGSGTISSLVTLNAGNAGVLLTNNSGATLTMNGGLTLSNANVLAFDLGTTSDQIALNGSTFTQDGTATIYVAQITGFGAGTYDLVTGASGILAANFTLGNTLTGYSLALSNPDASTLRLTVTVAAPATAFWHNRSGTSWTTINNWDTDQSSGTALTALPGIPTDVTFAADLASQFNTTLGADFSIHSLTLSTPNNVTIGGANTLTISSGINNSGASNVISARVVLGTDQTWINNSSSPLTVNSNISGAHSLTINDNGNKIILNGVNTYSSGTILTAGKLVLGNPTNTLADAGAVLIDNSSTLSLGANNDTVGAVGIGTGSITGTGGTLTATSITATNATINANVSGTTLTVNGGGTTTLSGTNSFSGATTIASGSTLILSGNNSAATGPVTDNGTLQLVTSPTALGAAQVVTVSSANTLYLKADASTTFNSGGINAGQVLTINADQAVSGVSGSTLTLNGPVTWTVVSTTLNAEGGNNYNLSLGDLFGGNGGNATLSANTANLTIHSFNGLGNSSGLIFTGTQNIDVTGGITNANTKGLALTFIGSGTVTLWGPDSLTGGGPSIGSTFSINKGTVVLNNSAAVSAVRTNITLGAAGNGNVALLLGGTDGSGLVGGISLAKNIVVQDTGGDPLILGGKNTSGVNTYSGTVTLGSTADTGKSVTLLAATGGEVDFTDAIRTNGLDTTAGVTAGDASNKGVIKLLGANTYKGLTTVSNGTLFISTLHAGAGDLVVADGKTFGVTNAQNAASAALANVTLGSSGPTTNVFDGVASTTVPVINATGAVTVNGNSTIVITANNAVTNVGVYPLIKYGSLSGSFTLATTPTNFVASLTNDTANGWIALNVSSVYSPVTVNTNPTNITTSVSGGNLTLSWPTDHTGWTLQTQTNSLSVGLGTNWVNVAGSATTNQITIPISAVNSSVFFRLIYP